MYTPNLYPLGRDLRTEDELGKGFVANQDPLTQLLRNLPLLSGERWENHQLRKSYVGQVTRWLNVLRHQRGRGPSTVNHYIRAMRGFFRWLVKANRLGNDPLRTLTLVNISADIRRQRRELTADELRQLFKAAKNSNNTFRGLSGHDRYMLYLVAAGTGFRANALANLTPQDFNAEDATLTMAARFAKNHRTKVQPLPAEVSQALVKFLEGKPAGQPIWSGSWIQRAAMMLRGDLEAAGIAYAVEGPDGPEYADFHALRHSYLTLLGRSGVDLRTAQELAGHSTPTLTARYTHRRSYDLAGAVDKLPNLVPNSNTPNTEAEQIPLRMTGTDGAKFVPPAVPNLVQHRRIRLHEYAPMYTVTKEVDLAEDVQKSPESVGNCSDLHPATSDCTIGASGIRTLNQGIMSPLL